jgi:hypothetical protein
LQHPYSNIIKSLNFLANLLQQRLDIFFGRSEVNVINYPQLELNNDDSYCLNYFPAKDLSIEEKTSFFHCFCTACAAQFF